MASDFLPVYIYRFVNYDHLLVAHCTVTVQEAQTLQECIEL